MVILCINVVLGMICYWVYHITLFWTYIRCWFELVFLQKGAGYMTIRLYQATKTCLYCFPQEKRRSIPRSTKNLHPLGELGELWRPSSRLEDFWATLAGTDDCITLQARSGDLVEAPLGTWLAALQLFQNVQQIMYLCFILAVYCACEVSLVVSPHFFSVLFQHLQPQFSKSKAKLVGRFCGFKFFGWAFPHATARCLCRREFRYLDGGLFSVFGTLKSRNHQWFLKCRARWLVSISGLPNRIG